MDYSTELKRINDKYYNKIKKAYSKYIKNFDSIPDLTQNVYIILDNKCIGDYEDLAVGNNRGRCDVDTGNIYIRESAFCEHLLIHEFIHRLSRNFIDCGWIEGFMISDTEIFLNELINEALTSKICGYESRNYNLYLFPIFHKIVKKIGYDNLLYAYFSSDIIYLKSNLEIVYINRVMKDCMLSKKSFFCFIKALTYNI